MTSAVAIQDVWEVDQVYRHQWVALDSLKVVWEEGKALDEKLDFYHEICGCGHTTTTWRGGDIVSLHRIGGLGRRSK